MSDFVRYVVIKDLSFLYPERRPTKNILASHFPKISGS